MTSKYDLKTAPQAAVGTGGEPRHFYLPAPNIVLLLVFRPLDFVNTPNT